MKNKSTPGPKKSRITLASLKNKARGAFSLLTEGRPSINPNHNINSMRRAAHAINSTISTAKSFLSKDELLEFETWVGIQSGTLHSPKKTGVAWEVLGVLPEKIQPVRLSDALQQSLDTITRQKSHLENFNRQVHEVNSLIDENELFRASETVDEIINTHGYSYWAIEAKIALLFSTDRASDANQYIRKFSIAASGLNSFHLYHFGMRNESSQSTYRFKNIVKRRIADSSLPSAYRNYALYRSARILGNSSEELAAVISYELLTTKADLFLTSRRVALQILCNPLNFSEREVALCHQILSVTSADSALNKYSEDKIALSNDLAFAVEIAIQQCMGSAIEEPVAPVAPHVEKIAKRLAAFFSYSGSEADEDALRKQCLNYWWQLDAMIIDSAQSIIRIPDIFASSSILENFLSHPLNTKCVSVFNNSSAAHIAWRIQN